MKPHHPHLRRLIRAVLGAALLITAAACSPESPRVLEPVPLDALHGNLVPVVHAREAQGLDEANIERWLQAFLDGEAKAVVGDIDVADLLPATTQNVLDDISAQRRDNDRVRAEDVSPAIDKVRLWTNISAVEHRNDRLIVTDCTERQEQNDIRQASTVFALRRYVVEEIDGAAKLTSIEVLHDGWDPSRLGCVPQSFHDRAELVAHLVADEVDAIARDPHHELDDIASGHIAQSFHEFLDRVRKEMIDRKIVRGTPEERSISVLGLDRSELGLVIAVSVCRRFPEGLADRDVTTGELLPAHLPPGSTTEDRLMIQLDPVPAGSDAQDQLIGVLPGAPDCDEQP